MTIYAESGFKNTRKGQEALAVIKLDQQIEHLKRANQALKDFARAMHTGDELAKAEAMTTLREIGEMI